MGRKRHSLYDINGHATHVAVYVGQASPPVSFSSSVYAEDGKILSRTDDSVLSTRYEYKGQKGPRRDLRQ